MPDQSSLSADPAQLLSSLFTLLPVPVAIVNDANELLIANSFFREAFPEVKNVNGIPKHEVSIPGHGTFDLEIVPLNDDGLQIVYGVDISNEVSLRHQLSVLKRQLRNRFKPIQTTSEAFDFNETVRNVIRTRQDQLKESNIAVSLNLNSRIPPVRGDAKAITQVLRVLVATAEQAIRSAEHSGSIHIKTFAENGRVHMSICDTAGVAGSRSPHVSANVAIGLCAEIINDHGGEFFHWNGYSSGSIYTLELPAASE